MSVRDDISRMSVSRAERVREDFVAQQKFQELRLMQLKKRRARLIKDLDEQISKTVSELDEIRLVIEEIDNAHFNTTCDISEEAIKRILDDPNVPF